ncbi:MAG: hypothetical protein GY832_12715 [Chloroflexi bacterium]|nr:hypothetical protein [Chloroflexota bacterium]
MNDLTSNITFAARWISNLSLLTVVFACLALWGSIALLFTPPTHSPDSIVHWGIRYEGNARTQRFPVNISPFWLPVGLGMIMCGVGFATLIQTIRKQK